MSQRFEQQKQGVYDDVIQWLKDLEGRFAAWIDSGMSNHAVYYVSQYRVYDPQIAHPAISWDTATAIDKKRTMIWMPVVEACNDFIGVMERWRTISNDDMREHVQHIRDARQWFEQNNRERRDKWD
jgi:hypothetical protein